MLSLFAQLVIPDSEVIWALRLIIGYIIAAVMWGVRVEMRLAALAREDRAQAESTARNEAIMKEAITKFQATHEAVIRVEEGIKQIQQAVGRK
ncbi:MAG: hypothetical protein IT203_02680 [Fimbriimonadaceae bacterium]|nr:hypothetical protein [Fimbriimonadaceae bacterium]